RMSLFPRDAAGRVAAAGPVIEWEESNCLLCGGRDWSALVEAPDTTAGGTGLWFAVVQCEACGLCFTNPRPTCETIGRFYPSIYRPHRTSTSRRRRRWLPIWLTTRRSRHKERQELPWQGRGRLLDFGCGGGSFMARMHRQGWQVTGLDVSVA